MQTVQAICFDLDDTLWDLMPAILHAEATVYSWFQQHYPEVSKRYTVEDIRALRVDIAHRYSGKHYDLSFLRRRCFEELAEAAGYPKDMSEAAFSVFQQARNEVDLFDDVLPALQDLTTSFELFSLSNGNADLRAIGLSGYFKHSFSAKDLGFAKPDVRVFQAVCDQSGLLPAQVLHVGDDPHNDVAAPQDIGMPAVWVNRKQRGWPADLPEPAFEISDLLQLRGMLGA